LTPEADIRRISLGGLFRLAATHAASRDGLIWPDAGFASVA
jgi:predicted cobalt transporter CbtA